jgi:hypothetical protein
MISIQSFACAMATSLLLLLTFVGAAGAGAQAYASDAGTVIDNPAGMTRLEGHQLFTGFAPGVGTVRFDKTDSPTNNGGYGGDQAGYSYDSSTLKNKNRTTGLPIDEQHRVGFGAVHQFFEWINLGKSEVRTPNVRGSYERHDMFFLGFTMNWRTDSWRETFSRDEG